MPLLRLAVAAALSFVPAYAAASTIYTYTGQNYTSATLPYTTAEKVTGSFTLATALAANLQNGSVTPVSFSFSDGVQTISDTTASSSIFGGISTDASGNITRYSIQINNLSLGFIKLINVGGSLNGDSVRTTALTSASNTVAGQFTTSGSTAVTPEPGSLVLLGTGLLGVIALQQRKKYASA